VEGVVLRRSTKIAVVLAAATLALAGCAKDDKSSDNNSSSGSSSTTLDCDSLSGDGPKVGIAYDVGGQGDHSFNDAAAQGMKEANEQLSATCTEGEAAKDEPESAREERLRQMADAGFNPIIGVGFAYSDSVDAVSDEYKDISFGVVDGFDPTQPQVPINERPDIDRWILSDLQLLVQTARASFEARATRVERGDGDAVVAGSDPAGWTGGVRAIALSAARASGRSRRPARRDDRALRHDLPRRLPGR